MTSPRFESGGGGREHLPRHLPDRPARAPTRGTVWSYPRCFVVDVHDGDTIKVDIDFGQDIWTRGRLVRLAGIACRELSEPGGKEARDALAELLPVQLMVHIDSTGWDKFGGRIDGLVFLPDGRTVQSWLLAEGWAVAWDARSKQPKPPWPRVPGNTR